jgi:type I restriction enzyme S subunit
MRTKNVQTEVDLSDVWALPSSIVRRTDQLLKHGDILVSTANSWNLVGKCCWVPELPWPSTFGGFISALRVDNSRVDPRYLFRWFSARRTQETVRSFGQRTTSISNLNTERCLALAIPVPPLAEQRRIADILDRADALRTKRRAALAKMESVAQAAFLHMFGDPATNPCNWTTAAFEDVCPTRLGKMLDQKRQSGRDRRPYLRNANVQWFRFDLTEVFEMDFDAKSRAALRLRDGDLLICEGGEPGRAAIWRGEIVECYYQKALHRGQPRRDLALPEYLVWLLWFLAHRGGLKYHVTSATIAHLTGEKLKAMAIPVPPLALQEEFARVSDGIERLRATVQHDLRHLDTLFGSLQDRAFRGEL